LPDIVPLDFAMILPKITSSGYLTTTGVLPAIDRNRRDGSMPFEAQSTVRDKERQLDVRDEPQPRRTRQRAVFDQLLGDITSGRLRPGDYLPSEAELCKKFDTSRVTVARAIRDLKERGLLHETRGGRATVNANLSRRISLFTPFAQNVAGLGFMGANVYAHLGNLATHRGDHLLLQFIGKIEADPLEQMIEAANRVIKARVDGVLYYPVELPAEQVHYNQVVVDMLIDAGIAVVLVDRDIVAYPERSRFHLVKYDNFRGGYLLTEHIIRQGRRRIGYVGIPNVSSAACDRMDGYFDALKVNRLPIDPTLIRRARPEDLDDAFWRSLVQDQKLDAVVCNIDGYAAKLARYLASAGLVVGKDILIAGFGDQPFAAMLSTPLTTVRFPLTSFTTVCYNQLLWQMSSPSTPIPGQNIIDVELIIRESTGGASS
jgi:GntR family transcriptional regulator, arabinose operon transcriptional repressor